jgi:hypothetical protein
MATIYQQSTVIIGNQPLSLISQGQYALNLPAACIMCTLILFASNGQCTQGDIFYFGGLQLPISGSPSSSCNNSLTLIPPNYWSQSNAPSTGQSPGYPNCSSTLTTFTTNVIGAFASLSFKGSGVSVFGTISTALYVVVR